MRCLVVCSLSILKTWFMMLQCLCGVWVEQGMRQWGHGSFRDLSSTCRFCKLGEFMGCSVVFLFQMMEAPAAEGEKRAMDSAEDVTERSSCFLCINRLHHREGVRFKNDMGGCSYHEQEWYHFPGQWLQPYSVIIIIRLAKFYTKVNIVSHYMWFRET